MISHVVRHNAVRGRPRGPLLISVNHRLLSKADPLVLMGHSAGAHLMSLDNAGISRVGSAPGALPSK